MTERKDWNRHRITWKEFIRLAEREWKLVENRNGRRNRLKKNNKKETLENMVGMNEEKAEKCKLKKECINVEKGWKRSPEIDQDEKIWPKKEMTKNDLRDRKI